MCDILPGQTSPMHRTDSIDYGVIMVEEIELDCGAAKILRQGQIVVQQTTIHLWRNLSQTKTCRIIFILVEATLFMHQGEFMKELKP